MENNILKIAFIYLLTSIISIIFAEIIFFNIEKINYLKMKENTAGAISSDIVPYSFKVKDFTINKIKFRPVENYGNKKTFLLFGCSYNYGTGLKDNETLSHKLAKATGGTAYNKAFPGWGAQHMLYQLKQKELYGQIETPPDYIIYTYIPDHLKRLNNFQWGNFFDNTINLRYKKQNGDFVEVKPFLKQLWFSSTVKEIQYLWAGFLNSKINHKRNFELFSSIMTESYRLLKNHYPNTTFVILVYPFYDTISPEEINELKNLQEKGFTVINVQDLVKVNLNDDEYHFGNDCHPTEKAWDVIAPALLEKLEINPNQKTK